jgi:hypothetical protein
LIRLLGYTTAKITLILVTTVVLITGCHNSECEGFAIYLTEEDIPPGMIESLSHVKIADQPVISTEDIITYNAQIHEMKLTDKAFERISQLEVPVSGTSFLACVDKKPVYWGAFWTPISSISFDGITIWKPFGSQETKVITIELGYPSFAFYSGEDPRNDDEIMESLEQAGKLVDKISINEIDKLPSSFKGYELYSWLMGSQWHFTLITGTNRNKTLEEVISEGDYVSESGWVKIHVSGLYEIQEALNRLPENEAVYWCDGLRLIHPEETNINIQLPPEQITDAIKEYAEQHNLELVITIPY